MTSVPSDNPWLQTLIRSLDSAQRSPLGEPLPKFPSVEMQQNTTGLSAEAALRQAHAFYSDVDRETQALDRGLDAKTRVLDFGFGWGRISRTFMEKISIENLYGVDVDPSFVEMTRALFDSDHFDVCAPFPPTRFEDGSFDLVIAYSVFSHLSEKACAEWMREFARIVKPGGIVAWTTRHDSFFDFCQWAKDQGDAASDYIQALGALFPDLDDARLRYRNGEIVHGASEGVGGGGPRDASFYGETWIPPEYARKAYAEHFTLAASCFDGSKYDQACLVFQRK
ncbi:MAG: class I SAM-dependent methyltransferase [Xanthomonadaceae bacterium]|nr:class I SAM-dependent methyltransferase [Xanthomonadaceae bacterium]